MTDQIKNRVVGTIVIFAIAIIFLPNILDGKKQHLRDDFETIPVKPQYQSPDLSKVSPAKADAQSSSPKDNIPADTNSASTPEPETIGTASVPVKTKELQTEPAIVTNSATNSVKASPKIKTPVKEIGKKPSGKGAWVITVGSFKEPKNVNILLEKLRKNGFTAFSVPGTPRQGETSKVFVGPSFNRQQLAKLQPKLKAVINESGFISAYNPTEK